MSMNSDLDQRKKRILGAVVREHILRAEPVGSRILVDDYDFGAGSATIRNEMAALEDLGFLEQPHTSAGRVPTEQGYRYYVDSLMAGSPLPGHEEEDVRCRLDHIDRQVEELAQNTSRILSRLTSLMAVVSTQIYQGRTLKRVDLVPLDSRRILVVIVMSDGEVEKELINSPYEIDPISIKAVEAALGNRVIGQDSSTVAALSRTIEADIGLELRSELLGRLAAETVGIVSKILRSTRDKVVVDGANNMLDQPEFARAGGARSIFTLIEEQSFVSELLRDVLDAQQVVVKIGSEIATVSAQCSFVGASYRLPSGGVGALGIVGPTRMNYDRAVSAVSCVAHELSALI